MYLGTEWNVRYLKHGEEEEEHHVLMKNVMKIVSHVKTTIATREVVKLSPFHPTAPTPRWVGVKELRAQLTSSNSMGVKTLTYAIGHTNFPTLVCVSSASLLPRGSYSSSSMTDGYSVQILVIHVWSHAFGSLMCLTICCSYSCSRWESTSKEHCTAVHAAAASSCCCCA